eukprot:2175036-Prymnesium_polylepis.1
MLSALGFVSEGSVVDMLAERVGSRSSSGSSEKPGCTLITSCHDSILSGGCNSIAAIASGSRRASTLRCGLSRFRRLSPQRLLPTRPASAKRPTLYVETRNSEL